MSPVPHSKIAEALSVTRQHVSSLVKRGMPASSVEAARGWYERNVRSRHSRGRWRRLNPALEIPLDLSVDDIDLDLPQTKQTTRPPVRYTWTPAPLKLVDLDLPQVVSDEEVDEWLDSKVETVEDAVKIAGIHIQILRLYIDWMPHVMAERCNPGNPQRARQELEHWVKTLNRECFTDGEETPPG